MKVHKDAIKELPGNGGVVYWDMNDSAFGAFDIGSSDAANTTYAVTCPANGSFIDVSITHQALNVEPMSISQHYILQPGIPAIHLFTVIVAHCPVTLLVSFVL